MRIGYRSRGNDLAVRILAAAMLFVVLLSVLPLSALGAYAAPADPAEASTEAIPAVAPYVYRAYASTVINEFDSITASLCVRGEGASLSVTDEVEVRPFYVFYGDSAAKVTSDGATNEDGVVSASLVHTFSAPADLSAVRQIGAALLVPMSEGSSYTARLSILFADMTGESFDFSLTEASWNAALADVGALDARSETVSITITVERRGGEGELEFYADSIIGASDDKLEKRCRLLSADYTYEGCDASFDRGLVLDCSGVSPSVIIDNIPSHLTGEDGGFEVELQSFTTCSSVTLFWSDGDEEFSSRRSQSVKLTSSTTDMQTLRFSVSEGTERIRLVFDGDVSGEIFVRSIAPISYYGGITGVGSIGECRVNSGRVEISVSLPSAVVERYKGASVALYLFSGGAQADEITVQSVAYTERSVAEKFYFSVPLADINIYDGFFVAIKSGNDIIPADNVKYVTNPEAISDGEAFYSAVKKGMRSDGSEQLSSGISRTAIDVDVSKLVTLDVTDHVIDRELGLYADESYAEGLLDIARLAGNEAVRVNYILTFSHPDSEVMAELLLHPSAEDTAVLCAPNVASGDGRRALAAVVRFLCHLDDESAIAPGFVLGRDISAPDKYWNMGDGVSMAEYSREYAEAVRIVYNVARSENSGADVYLPFGTGWNVGVNVYDGGTFDSRSALENIDAAIKLGGDIAWKPAFNPYPENDRYISALDEYAGKEQGASYITVKNLEVLVSYVMAPAMQYQGQYRGILLLEQREDMLVPADDAEYVRADYIYSYYKVTSKNFDPVEGFIPYREVDENGLLSAIDTKDTTSYSSFALTTLGISDWKQLIQGFDITYAITRDVNRISLLHTTPAEIVGSVSIFSFKNKNDTVGWRAGGSCYKLSSGVAMTGHGELLSAYFTGSSGEEKSIACRFPDKYNFTKAPYLTTDIMVAGLSHTAGEVKLEIWLYSGDDCIVAEDTVKPNTWTSIVLPVNNFTGADSCDRMIIRLSGDDVDAYGEPILLMGETSACSAEYGSDEVYESVFLEDRAGKFEFLHQMWFAASLFAVVIICLAALMIRRAGAKDASAHDDRA